MTRITQSLISTFALLSIATTAQAGEETFDTAFSFNSVATIETNYANFEKTAKAACRAEIKRVERLHGRMPLTDTARFDRTCQKQLLNRAVAQTKVNVLIAYHQDQINPNAAQTKLASAK